MRTAAGLLAVLLGFVLAPATASSAVAADYPNPGLVTGDVAVHDPAMVRAPDGTYILVSTGDGLDIRTSTDRIAFRRVGAVWPNGASWTLPFTGGSRHLWAPDLTYRNGQFYLYYSASTFGSRNSAIFLATSPTAMPGTWTNRGLIVQTSNSSDHNAIDPNLVVDTGGGWWLSYGSFWSGIKLIRLDPSSGQLHPTDRTRYNIASRPNAGGAIEAPFIVHREGYYYLFAAFDYCCRGTDSTYRVMVGRSTSITGPYTDRNGAAMTNGGGSEVVASHGDIRGPGHPALLADSDGWLLIYHYYTSSGSRLGVNLVGWSGGWPAIY
ncbi:arabinan endo-1,5-alpha-L-arabinosidase [Actinophytocola sediminis]